MFIVKFMSTAHAIFSKCLPDRKRCLRAVPVFTRNAMAALLSKFLNGTAVIDPENDRYVNQVHRDDIASALFFLLGRKEEGAEIYNVVDDQPILQTECYRWLAQRLNRPLPPIGKLTDQRKRGDSNKRVSNAKLRRLGWTPQYPTFADSMETSILPSFAEIFSRNTRS